MPQSPKRPGKPGKADPKSETIRVKHGKDMDDYGATGKTKKKK